MLTKVEHYVVGWLSRPGLSEKRPCSLVQLYWQPFRSGNNEELKNDRTPARTLTLPYGKLFVSPTHTPKI